MNPLPASPDAEASRLSALVDGEARPEELDALCQAWRSDERLRARWHGYHLIGDVLRSDELAGAPAHDADFLARFRERLAQEPVILAPVAGPVPTASPRLRRRWAAPAAVAAACVLVVGALTVTRVQVADPAAAPQLAAAPAPAQPAATLVASPAAVAGARVLVGPALPPALAQAATPAPTSSTATGTLLRDAGLDRYLAAHRQLGDGLALGGPSPFLRSAAHAEPER